MAMQFYRAKVSTGSTTETVFGHRGAFNAPIDTMLIEGGHTVDDIVAVVAAAVDGKGKHCSDAKAKVAVHVSHLASDHAAVAFEGSTGGLYLAYATTDADIAKLRNADADTIERLLVDRYGRKTVDAEFGNADAE